MAVPVHENVLRLEVPVDDLVLVEVFQSQHYLGAVEDGPDLRELGGLPDVEEQFAPLHEVHDHVEFPLGLEGAVQLDDVGVVVHVFQDLSLGLGVQDLLLLLDVVLDEHLDGVEGLVGLLLHQVDLPEGPLADQVQNVEVLHTVLDQVGLRDQAAGGLVMLGEVLADEDGVVPAFTLVLFPLLWNALDTAHYLSIYYIPANWPYITGQSVISIRGV